MVVGPWVSHSCMVVVDQADSKEPPQSSRTRRCEESERRHLLARPLELRDELEITRLPTPFRRRTVMPALLIPVLWVGGAVVLLGGGYYIVQAMH